MNSSKPCLGSEGFTSMHRSSGETALTGATVQLHLLFETQVYD
jgi:hypothetical protein